MRSSIRPATLEQRLPVSPWFDTGELMGEHQRLEQESVSPNGIMPHDAKRSRCNHRRQ